MGPPNGNETIVDLSGLDGDQGLGDFSVPDGDQRVRDFGLPGIPAYVSTVLSQQRMMDWTHRTEINGPETSAARTEIKGPETSASLNSR
jgi:hypothetical protein